MSSQLSSRIAVADDSNMKRQPKILVSESKDFSEQAATRIKEHGDLLLKDLDRSSLMEEVKSADVLWIRLRHRIDQEVLNAGSHLKMIVTPTTGLNHIDLELAFKKGIRILSLKGEADFLKDVRATAELTVGLMLALLRKIPQATNHVVAGGWNRDMFRGSEICGKTIGIIGFGRLGKIVAKYLAAFDAKILVYDPIISHEQLPNYVSQTSLESLLEQADIVSLHANLTAENVCFFGKSHFDLMKQGSWFVNTARGELVDEDALEKALQNGRLRGAALDVLTGEQSSGMTEHSLVRYAREHDNLLITPHIGGATSESMAKTEIFMAEQFCQIWPTVIGLSNA